MASKLAEREVRTPARTAREVMNPLVYAVQADTPLAEAIQLMASRHISGVPVVDPDRQVVGVLTEADLIDEQKRAEAVPRTLLYGVMPLPDAALCEATRRGKLLRVRDMMTRPAVTATEDTTVPELATLMVRHWINRVPIVRGGRLIGIVSRSDLVRSLAEGGWRQSLAARKEV